MMHYKLPLVFEPRPEGGYTVTCPALPELLTAGDSVEDAMANGRDAIAAVLEIYRDLGKSLPPEIEQALEVHELERLWGELEIDSAGPPPSRDQVYDRR